MTDAAFSACPSAQFLLRGLPHLLQYSPEPTEKRKLLPDPDNEPDFYEISKLFPLPGDVKDLRREEAKAALAAKGIIISDGPPSLNVAQHAAGGIGINAPLAQHPSSTIPVARSMLNSSAASNIKSAFQSDVARAAAMNLQQSTAAASLLSGIAPALLAYGALNQAQAQLNAGLSESSLSNEPLFASRTEEQQLARV